MSLILEALNKADREREEQPQIPHLQTVHGRIAPPPPPKKHWGLYVVVALLVLILFLLIALLVRQSNTTSTAKATAVAPTAPAVAPIANPAPIATEPVKPSTTNMAPVALSPLNADVQSIYQDARTTPPVAARDVETLYEDEPAPQKKNLRSHSRLLEDLEAEAAAQDADQNNEDLAAVKPKPVKPAEPPKPAISDADLDPEAIQRMWEETKKAIPDAPPNANKVKTEINNALQDNLAAYKDVKFLHELPEAFQNSVPSINYNNHIYSEKAGAVILNKKTYKAGQEVAPGLLIERIASDGILMQYKGKRFKLGALSSWVNI